MFSFVATLAPATRAASAEARGLAGTPLAGTETAVDDRHPTKEATSVTPPARSARRRVTPGMRLGSDEVPRSFITLSSIAK
jgi:hypothetical protein